MSEIVLCVGKVCSGKSTFATRLKNNYGFHHFSSDEWMLHFYEPTDDRALFDSRLTKCEEMIYRVAEQILGHGGSVVLDAGFWTRAQRQVVKNRFAGLNRTVSLVYFPIDLERQLVYVERRNKERPDGTYAFDRATIETLNGFFEEPLDETVITPKEWEGRLEDR
jgi:predicted kinase